MNDLDKVHSQNGQCTFGDGGHGKTLMSHEEYLRTMAARAGMKLVIDNNAKCMGCGKARQEHRDMRYCFKYSYKEQFYPVNGYEYVSLTPKPRKKLIVEAA